MDKREPDARDGKMYVRVAPAGRSGISRLAVWVDFMVFLLGSNTCIPLSIVRVLILGITLCIYWLIVSSSKQIAGRSCISYDRVS